MSVQDILVYVDSSRALPGTVALAVDLADRHGARLSGAHVLPSLTVPAYALYPVGPDLIDAHRAVSEDRARHSKAVFDRATTGMGFTSEWRQREGDPAREICNQSRCADLVVIGQPDSRDPDSLSQQVVEDVVLGSSAPVLVVPYIGNPENSTNHTMIAWDGSRESARAVHDAIPFLEKGERVTVVTVSKHGGTEGKTAVGTEISAHLARYDLAVQCREVPAADLRTGDVLLSLVADESVDLLVMGAYGHSRLREVVMGGATDHILRHMTVPVFMAH